GVKKVASGRYLPGWVVADEHRIVDGDGNNKQFNGCTVWSFSVMTTEADVDLYVANRAAKGVNAIIFNAIEHNFSDTTPAWKNQAGDLPFSSDISANNPDFTDPNESYWTHIDYIIDACETAGITCFLFPWYVGINLGSEGWGAVIKVNGSTRMATYGTWIANRYKDKTNIVWCGGGDNGPVNGVNITTEHNAGMNAIKAADTNHLATAHGSRGESALDVYNESWLDFNSSYSNTTTTVTVVRVDYQLVTPLPTFLIESRYVNMGGLTDIQGMRIMYQAILSGAVGHFLGSSPLWELDTGWDTNLDADGAQYLTYVARLQAVRDLPSLTPDHSDVFVTAGKGTEGADYSPVVASSSILVALCNQGDTLTVDFSQFTGSMTARWYNPSTGTTQTDGSSPYANTGSSAMSTPDSNDWIMLLDLASLGLGAP
ncbi:MAG: DUF4038 domain-containing protein, partial [Ketobacter sp.]|nr:DUF4038 domain-containing protein [Ketobacter sp.]